MPLPDWSVPTAPLPAGAIAFRGQFQACVNGAFELRSGSRREFCGGAGWGRSETVGIGSRSVLNFGLGTMKVRYSSYHVRQGPGFARDWDVNLRTHSPAPQEFNNMLKRRIRNRIQSRDGRQIYACSCIAFVCCARWRAFAYLRISVRERINEWVTDPRAQPLNSIFIQS